MEYKQKKYFLNFNWVRENTNIRRKVLKKKFNLEHPELSLITPGECDKRWAVGTGGGGRKMGSEWQKENG